MDRDRTHQGEQYQQNQQNRYDDPSKNPRDQRAMSTYPDEGRQGGLDRSGSASTGGTGGDWQGFVVPYRYYGPGYAGVGYYAVYYQGGDGRRDEPDGATSGFDQRNVDYGQGQGAGAAWQGSRWQDRTSGGYAGRGPKGYKRSDDRIREEIGDRLTEHDALDASEIEVTVKDGVATLTGTVESRQSKRLAEDLAERAPGVRDVMNQIRVEDQGSGSQAGRTRQTGSEGTVSQSGSTATRSASSSRSRSGTSKAKAGTSSQTASRPMSQPRTSERTTTGSETGQPVGSGVGGATDGETGNGSTRNTLR